MSTLNRRGEFGSFQWCPYFQMSAFPRIQFLKNKKEENKVEKKRLHMFYAFLSGLVWGFFGVCVMRVRAPGCGWGVVVVSAAVLLLLAALGLMLVLILTRESLLHINCFITTISNWLKGLSDFINPGSMLKSQSTPWMHRYWSLKVSQHD